MAGSRDFDPYWAFADAVNNAGSLCSLKIGLGSATFPIDPLGPIDPSGLAVLASALRAHKALQELTWFDFVNRPWAPQNLSLDPVLQALNACPDLRKVTVTTRCASAGAIKALVQLQSAIHLSLGVEMEPYLAVADGIRQGHCNIKHLDLEYPQTSSSDANEAVKALASAIRLDRNLESLVLQMQDGITDEAGVTLAEALTVNKTMRKFTLRRFNRPQDADALSTPAFGALQACLHLRKVTIMTACASSSATKSLLQLPEDTELTLFLNAEHWLAVADEIRQGRCNIKRLHFVSVNIQALRPLKPSKR